MTQNSFDVSDVIFSRPLFDNLNKAVTFISDQLAVDVIASVCTTDVLKDVVEVIGTCIVDVVDCFGTF